MSKNTKNSLKTLSTLSGDAPPSPSKAAGAGTGKGRSLGLGSSKGLNKDKSISSSIAKKSTSIDEPLDVGIAQEQKNEKEKENTPPSPADWGLTVYVQIAVCEMNQYKKEIEHLLAVSSLITSLTYDGKVRGNVGHLDLLSINYTDLQIALDQESAKIVPSSSNKSLIRDCNTLVSLRKYVKYGDWDEVGRVVGPLMDAMGSHFPQGPPIPGGTQGCHPNCQDELLLITMELSDHMSKKRLNSALVMGSMHLMRNAVQKKPKKGKKGTKNKKAIEDESSSTGIDDKDLENLPLFNTENSHTHQGYLTMAIHNAENATFKSKEALQLTFDAKVAHCLRQAVAQNLWERPIGCDTSTSTYNVNSGPQSMSISPGGGGDSKKQSVLANLNLNMGLNMGDTSDMSIYAKKEAWEEKTDAEAAHLSAGLDGGGGRPEPLLTWGHLSMQQLQSLLQEKGDILSAKEGYNVGGCGKLFGLKAEDPLLRLFRWTLHEAGTYSPSRNPVPVPVSVSVPPVISSSSAGVPPPPSSPWSWRKSTWCTH